MLFFLVSSWAVSPGILAGCLRESVSQAVVAPGTGSLPRVCLLLLLHAWTPLVFWGHCSIPLTPPSPSRVCPLPPGQVQTQAYSSPKTAQSEQKSHESSPLTGSWSLSSWRSVTFSFLLDLCQSTSQDGPFASGSLISTLDPYLD